MIKYPSPMGFKGRDVTRLQMCIVMNRSDYLKAHEATQRRLNFLRTLKDYAENGKIALVESGRDCDGVEYTGVVHIVDATKEAVETETEHIGEWTDGPFQLQLERPSVAATINRTSRDRTMEAHEDGHGHVIYSSY
jgi:hypothetical protein